MTADLRLSLCRQQRTDAALPSLTSPPKKLTIGPIGISLASTSPLKTLDLRDLDQSCVDTDTPYTLCASCMCKRYRSSASASGSSSSTDSVTSSTGCSAFQVLVLVISPCGVGIIYSP